MKKLKAVDVMNPRVLTVPEAFTLPELAAFLVDHEISGAPVEDVTGRLVGVVSTTDLARATSEGGDRLARSDKGHFYFRSWKEAFNADELEELHVDDESVLVRDIMTPEIYSVEETAPVSELARMMSEGHLRRVLVTRGPKVAGIVSASDLLQLLIDE